MSRRATIRTTHEDADVVARALRPGNTDEMETVVETDAESSSEESATDDTHDTVRTRIERETTGGLHSNVDDYAVNLEVAMTVADATREEQFDQPMDAGCASEHEHDTTNNE
ncbi:KEOPS complex subunit Pcc1 [Natronorubrum daqingense]|uniref:KEOPS complex Pcc1-like subunit n=1 Tax=Natronorubrum daqingense TaxID=588898 RepID=A0A1N6Z057_9EURY|nr:KEOPS complex subunit Pcc1 [Natronorubrum daqingense]APX95503.1 KEOPS complex Pcc1-like subunit [Natronorubrum daqingense]SIR20262.1 hypothetical protein SAMN05421809_0628 [Natronorubrum daqingense]